MIERERRVREMEKEECKRRIYIYGYKVRIK